MVRRANELWLMSLVIVVIGVQSSSLDDFSNNLATDLGPLLQLFGEPVTTQYLSESTTFLDYFIFAMAPIGILTAIVSVIRVCGDSSLRAFIGRSQEGDGQVEAELCTSTSRDVCELFNKGGVTRVLGRPKILEIIQLPEDERKIVNDQAYKDGSSVRHGRDNMGIFLFHDHLQNLQKDPPNGEWEERKSRNAKLLDVARWGHQPQSLQSDEEGTSTKALSTFDDAGKNPFTPNPNLSLNVGIVKLPKGVFYSVAVLGFVLQAGVLVMAGLVSWRYKWTKDSNTTTESLKNATIAEIIHDDRSPLTFICGSFFMCLGMYLCAALIGQSTREYIYQRKQAKGQESPRTRLFWLQPGNQVIGDQTFDAFAYAEEGTKHLTQYISSRMDLSDRSELYTWITIIVTLGGYVAQFIGLRGMNASVSIAQLGTSLVMSFLRGCLRMHRLRRTDNKLAEVPDKVLKHELDWLAFEIGTKDLANTSGKKDQLEPGHWLWYPTEQSQDLNNEDSKPVGSWPSPNKLFGYRSRLAVLTGHPDRYAKQGAQAFQQWDNDQVEVRSMALCLQRAIEGSADALIGDCLPSNAKTISFSLPVRMANDREVTYLTSQLELTLRKNTSPSVSDSVLWTIDSTELEAILGLWVWSLKKVEHLEVADDYGNNISIAETIPNYRIIGFADGGYHEAMEMWLGDSYRLKLQTMILNTQELQKLHSMTFWQAEGGGDTEAFVPWKVTNINRNTRRLFGWPALKFGRGSRPDTISVQCAPTGLSLLNQVGHEFFASFIKQLYRTVRPDFGGVNVTDVDGRLRWQNSIVSSMASCFEKSGLGSSMDALLCLLPTLREGLRPPDGELMISPLLDLSAAYRKVYNWDRIETIFRWACDHYLPSNGRDATNTDEPAKRNVESIKSILIVTGELYRWALASKNRDWRIFGYNGIDWMLSQLRPRVLPGLTVEPYDKDINEILDRYQEISSLVALRLTETAEFGKYKDYHRDNQTTEGFLDSGDSDDEDSEAESIDSNEIWDVRQTTLSSKIDWDSSNDIVLEATEEDTEYDIDLRSDEAGENYSSSGKKEDDSEDKSQVAAVDDQTDRVSEEVLAVVTISKEQTTKEKLEKERTKTLYLLCAATSEEVNKGTLFSLTRAAQSGWIEVVTALIELKAAVNLRDRQDRTPLHYAAERGSVSIASLLLAHGADPDELDKQGQTPLLLATIAQAEDLVTMLLNTKRVSPSTPDKSGLTPLIAATKAGNTGIAEVLAGSGALHQSNFEDNSGRAAIWYAARKGHLEIIEILLRQDETRTDSGDHSGLTPLAVAGWKGDEGIFRLLCVRALQQIDPNVLLLYPDGSRRTILSLTIEQEFQDVFILLLSNSRLDLQMIQTASRGKSPESPTSDHLHQSNEEANALAATALGLTIQFNREAMFDSLLKQLSDNRFNIGNLDEQPLVIAASYGRMSMVKKLLSHDKVDPNDGGPLSCAVSKGYGEIVKTLLHDGRIDVVRGEPLMRAVARGSTAIVEILLSDPRFELDNSHLEAAFQKEFFSVAWLLIQRAKNPNMIFHTYDDGNVLHIAARYGKPKFAKSLLGIPSLNPNLFDNKGQTPLSRAFSAGSIKVAAALLSDERTDLENNNISGCSWSADQSSMASSRGTIVHFAMTLSERFAKAALALLLKNPRLDPNAIDCAGRTPIIFLLEPDCADDRAYTALHILLDDPLGRVRLNETAPNGRMVIHLAAESGRGIEQLLSRHDIDPNIRDCLGHTPLHAATLHRSYQAIRLLLARKDTDPNIPDCLGQTPLHTATLGGIYEAIRLLLADIRIDPTICDNNMKTAFNLLDMNNYGKCAVIFLTDGRFDYRITQGGTTALHILAGHWTHDLEHYLRMFLESGKVEPNQRDIDGHTALLIAIRGGHAEAVQILLSNKALEPNLADLRGETPLHILMRSMDSSPKWREMLASFFANPNLDPNRLNSDGQTALHLHLELQQSFGKVTYQVVKAFVEDGRMDSNIQDAKKQTALHLAGREAHQPKEPKTYDVQVIKMLLKDKNTNPNIPDHNGQTAFQEIVSNINLVHKRRGLVQAFLNLPVLDLNIQDPEGRTILHLAVRVQPDKRYESVAVGAIKELLRDKRLNPKIVDHYKQTALHVAINANFTEAVRVLIQDSRIDASAQDEKGNTILHQAVALDHKETVELLLGSNIVDRSLKNGARLTAFDMAKKMGTGTSDLVLLFRRVGELISNHAKQEGTIAQEEPSSDELVSDSSIDTSD